MWSSLPKPVPILLAAALLLLPAVWLRSAPERAGVVVWHASPTHGKVYQQTLDGWAPPGGGRVELVTSTGRAMGVRLLTMFMGGRRDPGVPDIVQIEISELAPFLRPPADGIGLLPLDRYLDAPQSDGPWRNRILATRLATGTRSGQVFALPFDLHPTALAWRDDLWLAAGIDPAGIHTWDEFHLAALRYEAHWRSQGLRRSAFAVKATSADQVRSLLLQRHVDVATGEQPALATPEVADTLLRFARMTAGAQAIGSEEDAKTMDLLARVEKGEVAAFLCPDWRADMATRVSGLRGRLSLRPLPVFAAGDAPTTTFGGQLIGLTRACRNPDRAWAVIERILLSPVAQTARLANTAILPATPADWAPWQDRNRDGFFLGEGPGTLFTRLAPATPTRQAGPAALLARDELGEVLDRVRAAVDTHPALEQFVHEQLAAAQLRAAARLAHEAF